MGRSNGCSRVSGEDDPDEQGGEQLAFQRRQGGEQGVVGLLNEAVHPAQRGPATTAAARLRHHPELTVAALEARLRDRRLHELRAEDRVVASVFAMSVDQLPGDHRDLLVMVSRCTSAPVDRHAAAALCGVAPEVAEAMLEELADRHQLDEPVDGRYQPHDLFRVYCVEELSRRVPEERRRAVGYGQRRRIGDGQLSAR